MRWTISVCGFVAVLLISLSVSAQYAGQRCVPACDEAEMECNWIDRTWPAENVCEFWDVRPNLKCGDASPGWGCQSTSTDLRCYVKYWNYIGMFGGPENCSITEPENSCGMEVYVLQSGPSVPDSCTESFN